MNTARVFEGMPQVGGTQAAQTFVEQRAPHSRPPTRHPPEELDGSGLHARRSHEDDIRLGDLEHARWVSRYEGESVDADWAAAMTKRVSNAIQRVLSLPTSSAQLLAVTCKTSMCTVNLEWPSYGDAVRETTSMLALPVKNCARHLYIPPPDGPMDAYRASLYLSCELTRSAH
jgi:hypothetical protein